MLNLWRDFAHARRPVRKRCARAAAAPDCTSEILLQGTGLGNVLGGHPDGVAVSYSSAIVTPARSWRIAHKCLVAGEAVGRAKARCSNVDWTDSPAIVDCGIPSAGIVV